MNEKTWLAIGATIVAALVAIAAATLYFYPLGSLHQASYTPTRETFYYSVSSGTANSSAPVAHYTGDVTAIIENASISVTCNSCYYFGWYNSTSVYSTRSGNVSSLSSQLLNGTGAFHTTLYRNHALSWSVEWNVTMISEPGLLGSFVFYFTCPNSSAPIVSFGPVTVQGRSAPQIEAYSIGSFSDINNSS